MKFRYLLVFTSLILISCNTNNKVKNATQNNEGVSTSEPTKKETTEEKEKVNKKADEKPASDSDIDLGSIKLPPGFKIELYAEDVTNARSMSLSPKGTLFVGTRGAGNVYALEDTDNDYKIDKQHTLLADGNLPNGVAFRDDNLYVAEVNRVLMYENIEDNLAEPNRPYIINEEYPTERHHGWKYIAFGPDGKLYVPVGAPCNICESEDRIFNSITRINADGTGREIVHEGIRNTVGFTWHPVTKKLWFTDNGRDYMGEDMPACELNTASKDNLHFGYPYCHQGDALDPEFGKPGDCDKYVAPVQNLGAHTAPLGVEFYTGRMFPDKYKNNVAFIAEHGSWNRKKKIGYKISMVTLDDNYKATSYTTFAEGWLNHENDDVWGRPVDIEWLPDGSMLISDDFANCIYRVTYSG